MEEEEYELEKFNPPGKEEKEMKEDRLKTQMKIRKRKLNEELLNRRRKWHNQRKMELDEEEEIEEQRKSENELKNLKVNENLNSINEKLPKMNQINYQYNWIDSFGMIKSWEIFGKSKIVN